MFKPVDHLYVNPVATSTAVNLPVNHINDTSAVFGTPVMCRRQKGFYFLLTLFILGVIILVFIAVSSVIIYITHPCASLDCFYGAECIVDSNGKEARCQCENYCQSDPRSSETVCGSNGIPYPSECHLRVASCSIQTNIYVKSKGSCDNKGLESSKSVSLSGSEEGKTRSPVASGQLCNGQHCAFGSMCTNGSSAGSAGPGYQCLCPDNCQDYGQVKQYLQSVLRYPGLLGDSSRSSGPQSHGEPLCGTDGRDYGSVCQLAKVSCEETREIQVKFKGKCGT
ncbi:Agrin [Halotydeus destructor]|nr:Agrin [Halotydeus destructor]